jgi:hypothetical protein
LYGWKFSERIAAVRFPRVRVTVDGTVTLLHAFLGTPSDIGPALGRLAEGSDGDFYGIAFGGEPTSPLFCAPGVIFKISAAGSVSVVHTFAPRRDGSRSGCGLRTGLESRLPDHCRMSST